MVLVLVLVVSVRVGVRVVIASFTSSKSYISILSYHARWSTSLLFFFLFFLSLSVVSSSHSFASPLGQTLSHLQTTDSYNSNHPNPHLSNQPNQTIGAGLCNSPTPPCLTIAHRSSSPHPPQSPPPNPNYSEHNNYSLPPSQLTSPHLPSSRKNHPPFVESNVVSNSSLRSSLSSIRPWHSHPSFTHHSSPFPLPTDWTVITVCSQPFELISMITSSGPTRRGHSPCR